MSWATLQATKVKPGDPPRRDPRARRVVDILKGPRTKRRYTVVLECGHTQRRRMLFEPDLLICTDCPPCGGIGNNMGHH